MKMQMIDRDTMLFVIMLAIAAITIYLLNA